MRCHIPVSLSPHPLDYLLPSRYGLPGCLAFDWIHGALYVEQVPGYGCQGSKTMRCLDGCNRTGIITKFDINFGLFFTFDRD